MRALVFWKKRDTLCDRGVGLCLEFVSCLLWGLLCFLDISHKNMWLLLVSCSHCSKALFCLSLLFHHYASFSVTVFLRFQSLDPSCCLFLFILLIPLPLLRTLEILLQIGRLIKIIIKDDLIERTHLLHFRNSEHWMDYSC